MKFSLVVTQEAERDIREAVAWWSKRESVDEAFAWYERIREAIETLSAYPTRYPRVPESDLSEQSVRQLLFGVGRRATHRIVFLVEEETVAILRVRHLRQPML